MNTEKAKLFRREKHLCQSINHVFVYTLTKIEDVGFIPTFFLFRNIVYADIGNKRFINHGHRSFYQLKILFLFYTSNNLGLNFRLYLLSTSAALANSTLPLMAVPKASC